MTAYNFGDLEQGYNDLIETMEIKPSWKTRIDNAARSIITNKERYQAVSDDLQVVDGPTIPWQFIGIIHHLEGDGDFNTHLHNGDPLTHRTTHVPAGRPVNGVPPFTWEESAIDALKQRNLQKIVDWSPAHMAYEFEGYNGFGYRGKGINSPYLWSGTNHYSSGKYISDGEYSETAVSQQCGAMPIFSRIIALDITPQMIVSGSRKLTLLQRTKAAFTATFGSYFTMDYFNVIPDYVKKFQALGINKEIWIILGASGVIWAVLSIVESMSVTDYKNNSYTPSKQPENVFNKDIKL